MKRMFALMAMALMAVSGGAQEPEQPATDGLRLVAEKDWTEETEFTWWVEYYDSGMIYPELVEEGLALTNPTVQAEIWTPQVVVLNDFSLERGHDYLVRLTLKVPSDGTYQVNFGSWDAREQYQAPVTAGDDFQVVDVEFPHLVEHAEVGDNMDFCFVLLQYGWVAGTTIVRKVQVYEKTDGGTTAIRAAKAAKADGVIYNLAGQRVNASYKGVVIQNGRKRMVR